MQAENARRVRAKIRRASAQDASAVAEVFIASRRAAATYLPNTVHSEDEDRRFVRDILIASMETWVATDIDGRVTALLALRPGWIDQLYVHPEFANHGIGSMLVDHAKDRQRHGLQLWTFASNLGAQRFYERHGFVEAERTDGADNEERAPDIRYVWNPTAVGSNREEPPY